MIQKGTAIITFEFEEEDYSLITIEKKLASLFKNHLEDHSIATVIHLEVAAGNMKQAFGLEY
jgi:c-di-GMP-binding flagellar brake protein YcgR